MSSSPRSYRVPSATVEPDPYRVPSATVDGPAAPQSDALVSIRVQSSGCTLEGEPDTLTD